MNLKGAWNKVKELGYNPYYLGLYGSQNYGLDTEESDFDYKCIILPTLDDLIYQTKPTSVTIEFEGGLIDIKDIRIYIESAVKVNVNFIEILNTEYYLGHEEIRAFYTPLLKEMGCQYLKACFGMMKEKQNALCKEYPSKEFEIKTYGYDPKQLCHIVRLSILIKRYISGNFDLYHKGDEKNFLLGLKSGFLKKEKAIDMADEYIIEAKILVDEYLGNNNDVYDTKNRLIDFSRLVVKNNINTEIFNNMKVPLLEKIANNICKDIKKDNKKIVENSISLIKENDLLRKENVNIRKNNKTIEDNYYKLLKEVNKYGNIKPKFHTYSENCIPEIVEIHIIK